MNINKFILVAAVGMLSLTSCKQSADAAAEPAATNSGTIAPEATSAPATPKPIIAENTGSLNLKIEGMSCAVMCAAKIEKELAATPGVTSAKVDFDTQTASVKYDNKVLTPQQLADKVQSVAGGKLYTVTEATAL